MMLTGCRYTLDWEVNREGGENKHTLHNIWTLLTACYESYPKQDNADQFRWGDSGLEVCDWQYI